MQINKMVTGGIAGKIWRRLRRYYRQWFCHRNYIFRHEGPFCPEERIDCTFACYESFEELPEQVKKDLCAGDNSRLEIDRQELSENATLWVAFVGGRVATTVFTRQGKYFRRWFLDIRSEDIVVFRLNTQLEFRGRGLAPALIRHVLHETSALAGHAYIDCRTYNKPSKRCIEKAGFKCVAIKKTIKREWALYN